MIRAGFSEGQRVLVLYDGVPAPEASDASQPAIPQYVTGYDWLVAAAWASQGMPDRQFALVDVTSAELLPRRLIAAFRSDLDAVHVTTAECAFGLFAKFHTHSLRSMLTSDASVAIPMLRDLEHASYKTGWPPRSFELAGPVLDVIRPQGSRLSGRG